MKKITFLPLLMMASALSTALPAQTTTVTSTQQQFPAVAGTSRYVTSSDGTQIAVTDSGPAFSPNTILLVHGFLHNSQVWFKQLNSPALAGFRIVTMDLRGHGYSAKPTDPSAYADLNLQADDIEAVIHGLGLHKPILAGWSLGGISVRGYLQKYGDKELSGVDLIDSIACPDAVCVQTVLSGLANLQSLPELISTDADTALAGETGFINLETGGSEQNNTAISATDRLVLEEITHSSPQYVRSAILAAVAGTEIVPVPQVLQALHVPLLVQHGQNDPIFPASLIAGEVKLVKNATVKTYPNTAHTPFFLTPDVFNLDLATWIIDKVDLNLP